METVPGYVSIVFILTTFASVAFLLQTAKYVGLNTLPSRILVFLLPLWIISQTILSVGGFYQRTDSLPPRLAVFGAFPALLLIATFFIFFRKSFVEKLPLGLMTMLHAVRIPVELVLYWLFVAGALPQVMTFEGRNVDIVSGILAPIIALVAFRGGRTNKWLLIGYNLLGLGLLINIVTIAILSAPFPFQSMSFDQPNRAVLFFPYIWLPTIVVPIVLFS
ncbi:MAG: hypothetical protein ABL959_09205, partial [Pyrinomonadaceae bacterium]